jgi:hypothetical protein
VRVCALPRCSARRAAAALRSVFLSGLTARSRTGALLYVAGAAPALLPALYLLFAAVAGPWRAWDFVAREKSKNAFFLADFCYVRAPLRHCLPARLVSRATFLCGLTRGPRLMRLV